MEAGTAASITGRLVRTETRLDAVETDIKELRGDDLKEIKADIKELKEEFLLSQRGMSKGEKLMFSGIIIAAISAITAVVALLVGGAGPA